MANLGGISLADAEGKLTSGAAFLLGGPSRVSETLDVCGTGEITVLAGNPYLIARHTGKQLDQLLSQGFELAQKGLDLLSVAGKADLTLRDFSDEHILWWPASKGRALRVTSTFTTDGRCTTGDRHREGSKRRGHPFAATPVPSVPPCVPLL